MWQFLVDDRVLLLSLLIARNAVALAGSTSAPGAAFEPDQDHFAATAVGETVSVTADAASFRSGLTLRFAGADPRATGIGLNRSSAVTNYFLGNDPRAWRANVPRFSRVRFNDVYPGIDIVYHFQSQQLEFDLNVAPGADPRDIQLRVVGAQRITATSDGALEFTGQDGTILLKKAIASQEGLAVDARYIVEGETVRIGLGDFDRKRRLVIDPLILFSVYAGDQFPNTATQVVVDAAGNSYVVATRTSPSPEFPVLSLPLSVIPAPPSDVAVSKFDAQGNLAWVTHLGGKGNDIGLSIAVDGAGEAIVAGSTNSFDFPVWDALQPQYDPVEPAIFFGIFGASGSAANANGFITKLSADGSALIYSTYFGGQVSAVNGVAADATGNAYVTGSTAAMDFPITQGAFQKTSAVAQGEETAFVSKFSPNGSQLVFSTFLGGTYPCIPNPVLPPFSCLLPGGPYEAEAGNAIAVDPAGNVYVTGYTSRPDFPVTSGVLQTQCNCGGSVAAPFVTKFKPDGSGLVYSTFLGGSFYDVCGGFFPVGSDSTARIATDAMGNAYLTGQTADTSFPVTPGAYQPHLKSMSVGACQMPTTNAFAVALNPVGSALIFGTYLGGPAGASGNSIAFDSMGNAYITGSGAPDFPQTDSSFPSGDAFLAEVSSDGTKLIYSGRFPGTTTGQDVAIDSTGNVLALGSAGTLLKLSLAASTVPALLGAASSAGGPFTNRLAPGELVSLYGAHLGPASGIGAVVNAGAIGTQLQGVQVLFDGVAAPLLYVQQYQINAVVPYGVAGHGDTLVEVVNQGAQAPPMKLAITDQDIRIFRHADGSTLVLNSDGSVNSQTKPARAGSTIVLYATGGGSAFDSGAGDGTITAGAKPLYAGLTVILVSGTGATASATSPYTGPAPGLVNGTIQINVQLPALQLLTGGGPDYWQGTVTLGASQDSIAFSVEL